MCVLSYLVSLLSPLWLGAHVDEIRTLVIPQLLVGSCSKWDIANTGFLSELPEQGNDVVFKIVA